MKIALVTGSSRSIGKAIVAEGSPEEIKLNLGSLYGQLYLEEVNAGMAARCFKS